jgi:2-phospho-L-lactate transferase/gluconeogenesis factor (CofD/UPF0052 family)
MKKLDTRIAVIGGGTGGFTLLGALKNYYQNVTALVNMADDGGSTGLLRDELGVLPPGDVRKSLVALSKSPKVRDLFSYRFEEGTLQGHTFGNLFLTALEKLTGNFAEGVETASEVLKITGRVVPITLDNTRLVLEWPDGQQVLGQHKIDVMDFSKELDGRQVIGEGNIDNMHFPKHLGKPSLRLDPEAHINPDAVLAIESADIVILSAGDIYTSIGPALAVRGVREALATTKAQIVYVCNLVTKPGQTSGFTVSDHAAEIERLAGGHILDYVLYNTAEPPAELFNKYVKDGEYLVEADEPVLKEAHYQAIGAALLAEEPAPMASKGDSLAAHRSLIRHDGDQVAKALMQLPNKARI